MITVCPHRNVYEDVKKVVNDCTNIVDGGSFYGAVAEEFHSFFPNATIHCFEPVPENAKHISNRATYIKNIKVYPYALGEKSASITMRIGEKPETSSIPALTLTAKKIYGDKVATEGVINVPVRTLDSLLNKAEIIKLDVHGYELAALRGATKLLQTTKAIIIEICFVPIFLGQPCFQEINCFLSDLHFSIFNFYHLCSTETGELVCADVLYVRNSKP